MKMNFTKNEYQTLVEMLLVADWVITAHEEEEREETRPYRELRKEVLSHHKEMGMAEAFVYSPKEDEYFETAAYGVGVLDEPAAHGFTVPQAKISRQGGKRSPISVGGSVDRVCGARLTRFPQGGGGSLAGA